MYIYISSGGNLRKTMLFLSISDKEIKEGDVRNERPVQQFDKIVQCFNHSHKILNNEIN